jgi:putative transposase
VTIRTQDGRPLRLLTIVDEYTQECLAIEVALQLRADDVLYRLADLFVHRGAPEALRSDNGPEFTAKAVRHWLARVGVRTLYIEPGSPWATGSIESFNGKLWDELLNGELCSALWEAQVAIKRWRQAYNQVRPQSALGYRPPAPEAIDPQRIWIAHVALLIHDCSPSNVTFYRSVQSSTFLSISRCR